MRREQRSAFYEAGEVSDEEFEPKVVSAAMVTMAVSEKVSGKRRLERQEGGGLVKRKLEHESCFAVSAFV